ncbi:ATP-binding cassette domain-containing protein [Galbibacter sp. BG1]|uniref:peptidase domain-containing ABC transporter n=1 Tax=Galbibacter sp. BG1 TaxID=1170699 RepID=UPI0015BC48D7|nr:ATP-binding cassette domain-containing protein [Galbibacter sp. BG1]QLE00504.1 ATP-binding cassette domain-containing protein [Galbibacter sp. BG1]
MKDMILTPWKRLLSLLDLERRDVRQVVYYAIFAGLVSLTLPLGIQAIINLIQGAQVSTSWIILVILVTLGVGFQGLLQYMQIRILENIQQKIFMRSSFEFIYRMPKIKIEELKNYYPPELANRFFDTITVQKNVAKILLDFPAASLQILFGLILLSFYHPFFIIYGILLIVILYVVFRITFSEGLKTSLEESNAKYKVAHWIQEVARSLISFKLSGKTTMAMKKNDVLTATYLNHREGHFKILKLQFIQMIGFKVLVTAGLLVIGGLLVLNQQMNIGQFVAAEIIILLVINSVEKVIYGLEGFYDILTSLEKIGQVVDKELETQEGIDPFHELHDLTMDLEGVSYKTPDGFKILKNVNLFLKSKDRIYLSGKSGSGKTTLLKIISGILTPTGGSMYVNDISMKGVLPNKYRAHVGQVLPEQTPFEATIQENITFGNPEISHQELQDLLRNLGLLEFVKKQSKGVNTIINPEGQKIPQTIAKRILIARAVIHNPKLLILKDVFENFESNEVEKLMKFLTHPDRPWALIISSHSESWKKYCTKEISLVNGESITKSL